MTTIETAGDGTTADPEAIWAAIATERRRLADELDTLTDAQWATRSQCQAWTVEELAVHLITPFEVSTARIVFTLLKHRGNIDRMAIDLTSRVAARTERSVISATLRANAENRWTPPRLGPEIPLSEIVVHGQDIRRPLGLDGTVPPATVGLALAGIDDPEIRADYADRIGPVGTVDR